MGVAFDHLSLFKDAVDWTQKERGGLPASVTDVVPYLKVRSAVWDGDTCSSNIF